MIEPTVFLRTFLTAALCIMMCVVFVCLVRALKGPRVTDRVVALNMIGTLVVMMICILSYLLEEAFLIDVAILYALLNMLVVVVLTRVATHRHYELYPEELEAKK
ncbi:MAG: sodium:proton antiporter [Oscillospiraceae bacterium]|nr:sodium:proton antiporter [Oscillospiraceae bacterium]